MLLSKLEKRIVKEMVAEVSCLDGRVGADEFLSFTVQFNALFALECH